LRWPRRVIASSTTQHEQQGERRRKSHRLRILAPQEIYERKIGEYNKNPNEPVKFLQIWIFPNKKNVTPRYDQITLNENDRKNKLQQVLSPNENDEGVWIQQDAWFHMGTFDKGKLDMYSMKKPGNGVYAFVLKGKFLINGIELDSRDGLGIFETNEFKLESGEDGSEILLIEVPMN
jgi:redox-sensitive bicupin YhaK (pirin superfamily)